MKKIYYVTSNKMKIDLAKKIFHDLDVEIIPKKIDIPEIQSLDCEEVAKFSACYASELLVLPVLKNDSGLVIPSLQNFPGALAKYTEDTIGAEGFLRLLEGKDRNCYWVETLAYKEPNKEVVVFTSYTYGKIAESVCEGRGYPFDKIFIPLNDNRTFSQMTYEEQLSFFDDQAYMELLEYLKDNIK